MSFLCNNFLVKLLDFVDFVLLARSGIGTTVAFSIDLFLKLRLGITHADFSRSIFAAAASFFLRPWPNFDIFTLWTNLSDGFGGWGSRVADAWLLL